MAMKVSGLMVRHGYKHCSALMNVGRGRTQSNPARRVRGSRLIAEPHLRPMRCVIFFPALVLAMGLNAQTDSTSLRIDCLAGGSTVLPLARVKDLPSRTVMVTDHHARSSACTGALLMDVLQAGCPEMNALDKKQRVALVVRVEAWDGYVASVALTEADTAFRAAPVLLVWERDGAPLASREGPLQLVVPDDLRQARHVRRVKSLQVVAP